MSRSLGYLSLAVLLICICSCTRPDAREEFRKASDKENGSYCFRIDMEDSLYSYDLDLYTRIDCRPAQFTSMPDTIRMKMDYTSPSGKRYTEMFGAAKDSFSQSSSFSKEYIIPYRRDLVPVEHGIWNLYITVCNEDRFPGMRGIGIQVRWKR